MATIPSSPPSLSIRKATPDDLPVLMPLIQGAYRGESSRRGWTHEGDLVAGQRIDAAGLLLKINEPFGAVLIVFPDDVSSAPSSSEPTSETSTPSSAPAATTTTTAAVPPVACCEVIRGADGTSDKAYFGLFAVDPTKQNGGLGRAVLARAEAYARDVLGASMMEMTVIWTREELISWYTRRGYVLTGEKRPFPYGDDANGVPTRDDLYFDVLEKQL